MPARVVTTANCVAARHKLAAARKAADDLVHAYAMALYFIGPTHPTYTELEARWQRATEEAQSIPELADKLI